jgi:hypothetical protein
VSDRKINLTRSFKEPHNLSKSVWDFAGRAQEDILNVVRGGLARGEDGARIARDLQDYLKPDGGKIVQGRWGKLKPGEKVPENGHWKYKDDDVRQYYKRLGSAGLDYRAIRLYRTEMYRNMRDSAITADARNPSSTHRFEWALNPGREEWGCECPAIAEYSKDEGGLTAEDAEYFSNAIHPNCDCAVYPVLKDHDEFLEELEDFVLGRDTEGAAEIDEWAHKYKVIEGIETTGGILTDAESAANLGAAFSPTVNPATGAVGPHPAAVAQSWFKQVDAATKEAFQDASNQVFATATAEQRAAAWEYTRYDFTETNQMLYGDKYFQRPENKDKAAEIKIRVKNLDKIIKDYKLTDDIVTYRGTDAELYTDWKVGKTYDLQGYVSTSLDKGNEIVDRDFVIEMRIKKGTQGMYLGTNSYHPGEDEFVLGRDRKYKVIEKTKNSMIAEVSN